MRHTDYPANTMGAAIADSLSLVAVFIVVILVAVLQLVLYVRLSRWEQD